MATWERHGQAAHLSAAQLTATIDFAQADPHLACLKLAGHDAPPWKLLGLRLSDALLATASQPTDVYVRNYDLIVTYAPPSDAPFRLETYWTFRPAIEVSDSAFGIDLQVSIQTSSLDDNPDLTTFSELVGAELFRVSDAGHATSWNAPRASDQQLPLVLARPNDADVLLSRNSLDPRQARNARRRLGRSTPHRAPLVRRSARKRRAPPRPTPRRFPCPAATTPRLAQQNLPGLRPSAATALPRSAHAFAAHKRISSGRFPRHATRPIDR